jgi:hypothetical protein
MQKLGLALLALIAVAPLACGDTSSSGKTHGGGFGGTGGDASTGGGSGGSGGTGATSNGGSGGSGGTGALGGSDGGGAAGASGASGSAGTSGAGGAATDAGDAEAGGSGGCTGSATASGLVLYYDCEELSGPTLFDATTNGNNGTAAGGVTFNQASQICVGIQLNGTGYIDAGKPASLSNLTAVTVSAWVRRDQVGSGYSSGIVAKTAGNGDFDFSLGIRSDGALYWGSASADPTYGYRALLSAAGSIGLGTWVHVAGTYSVASGERRFYLNGTELVATSDSFGGQAIAPMNGSGPVRVGSYQWTGGSNVDFLVGAVDEVRIWNVARTPAEICADAGKTFTGSSCQ